MKLETEFLKNFRANLIDMLKKENLLVRQRIIIWEITWIDNRLKEISQQEAERLVDLEKDIIQDKNVGDRNGHT